MLKALVVVPNKKTVEFGSLLAIARAEARKREKTSENPPILALSYVPELNVFIAVYQVPADPKQIPKREVSGRSG